MIFEKLTVAQLLTKFPTVNGIQTFRLMFELEVFHPEVFVK